MSTRVEPMLSLRILENPKPKKATLSLPPLHERSTRERLSQIMQHRILVLDGTYGSAFQNWSLSEEAFHAESYADHDHPLQSDHDILNLTQPQVVAKVHNGYLGVG